MLNIKDLFLSLPNGMLRPFGLIAMKIEDCEEVYRLLDTLKVSLYNVDSELPELERERIRSSLTQAQDILGRVLVYP